MSIMAEKFSEWMNLTVAEIKELLKSVDLPTSGKKEQMVERIIDYHNEEIRDSYRSMTIAELRELLKASGLPTAGKKQDLVERLFETSTDRIIDDRPSRVAKPTGPPMAPATARISLPLELLPDNEFIVKDWGINPYDPTASYQGFMNLSEKERKRLLKALADSPRNPAGPSNSWIGGPHNPEIDAVAFMGCLYFNDWEHFATPTVATGFIKLQAFLAAYSQPSTILNWNTEQFITMVRRTGKGLLYMGRLPFGKED